jgi:hypothetical protein
MCGNSGHRAIMAWRFIPSRYLLKAQGSQGAVLMRSFLFFFSFALRPPTWRRGHLVRGTPRSRMRPQSLSGMPSQYI